MISNLRQHNSVSIVHLDGPVSHSMAPANKYTGCVTSTDSIPPLVNGRLSGSVMFELCLLHYFDTVVHGPFAASECSFADNRPALQLGVPITSMREIATIRWVSPIDKPHVFKPFEHFRATNTGVVIAHPFQDSCCPIRIDPRSFIGVSMIGTIVPCCVGGY